MGKMSRTKGATGERELASVAREAGLDAERTAQLQAGRRIEGAPDVTVHTWPELHVEVKRDERMSVDRMVAQSQRDALLYRGPARVPVVAWRRNGTGRKGWRVDCPAAHYFAVLAELDHLRRSLAARDYVGELASAAKSSPERTTTTTEDT